MHVMYVVETGLFSSLPMDNTWEVMYSMLEKEGQEALSRAKDNAGRRAKILFLLDGARTVPVLT